MPQVDKLEAEAEVAMELSGSDVSLNDRFKKLESSSKVQPVIRLSTHTTSPQFSAQSDAQPWGIRVFEPEQGVGVGLPVSPRARMC